MKKSSGFTMVELIVVVAVLSILVSLSAIAYRGVTDSAHDAAIKADMSVVGDGIVFANAKTGASMIGVEDTTTTLMADSSGVVDVLALKAAGKKFYTIPDDATDFLKRTTKPINNYLTDSENNIYYKGAYSIQTVKKWSKDFETNYSSISQTKDGGYITTGQKSTGTGITAFGIKKIDANGNVVWDKAYHGTLNKYDWGNSIVQTNDGGYVATGSTNGVSGGISEDVWVIKVDKDGTKIWDKTFNAAGNKNDGGRQIKQTKDGGYIIGAGANIPALNNNGDVWLIKIDANGIKTWDKIFNGASNATDCAYSVVQTQDGGYAVAGMTWTATRFDVWIIKTDADGNKVWDKIFNGTANMRDFAYEILQTNDGGYIVVGLVGGATTDDVWVIKTDADGNKMWDKTFNGTENIDDQGSEIKQTNDGGYVIIGTTNFASYDVADIWLIKVDASGNKLWDKVFTHLGQNYNQGSSVNCTNDNGFIITGLSWNSTNACTWIIKTDAIGNIQ